jgi:uncharacterized protein YqeY
LVFLFSFTKCEKEKKMKLKERIQNDFITAMKAKDDVAKMALSGIKAKIIEAEKSNGNSELSDAELIKVINKAIKQREESQKIYEDAGRHEMAIKESDEACVLRSYMPSQMTESEIEDEVKKIMAVIDAGGNRNKLVGQTMGTFNKNFQGRADTSIVKNIIEKLA